MIIRVYILEFTNIMSKDDDSLSDPYMKIICNNKIIDVKCNFNNIFVINNKLLIINLIKERE